MDPGPIFGVTLLAVIDGSQFGSAFCFPYNSVTVRRILFKFGRFMH